MVKMETFAPQSYPSGNGYCVLINQGNWGNGWWRSWKATWDFLGVRHNIDGACESSGAEEPFC